MKISKSKLLNLSLVFTALWLWLTAVSTAQRQLYLNIDNASHYMESVKLISSWSEYSATLRQVGNGSVKIETPNFILSKTWLDNENSISTGFLSSILWWIKNRIEWEVWDEQELLANVIFGWSGNLISGYGNYNLQNVVLWWESNKIENWIKSVILWWKNNEAKWNHNVVLWSNNKIEDGTWSIIVWNNSYVKGDYSAALWSGSKVKANNSFLRNDGSSETTLTKDNLFVIMAKSGTVINWQTGHNHAKLTLWWPLIISSRDDDANIKCGGWEGGWILKMVNTGNQVCLCGCDGLSRNSMLWKGNCTRACNQDMAPVCGDVVTKTFDDSSYYFSGSCNSWKVVEWTWAYLVTKDNKVHRSCQTDDGQIVWCSGSADDYKYQSCVWSPATGHGVILWNSNSMTFSVVWHYTGSQTPWTCQWTCNTSNNFIVNDAHDKCICPTGYQLSEDGQSCIEIPNPEYICTWGYEPGENTTKWDGNPTNWNEPREYNPDCNNLWHCEWCCASSYSQSGHDCVDDVTNAACWVEHFDCAGWVSSNQQTWDTKWTWKCGENECKECRGDLWYYEDANGECQKTIACGSEKFTCSDGTPATYTWYINNLYTRRCWNEYCSKSNTSKYNVCRELSYTSCTNANPQNAIDDVSFKCAEPNFQLIQPYTLTYIYQVSQPPFVYSNSQCFAECGSYCGITECNEDYFWDIADGWLNSSCGSLPGIDGRYWIQYISNLGTPEFTGANAWNFTYIGNCPNAPKCWSTEKTCAAWCTFSSYNPNTHKWVCSNTMGESIICPN